MVYLHITFSSYYYNGYVMHATSFNGSKWLVCFTSIVDSFLVVQGSGIAI